MKSSLYLYPAQPRKRAQKQGGHIISPRFYTAPPFYRQPEPSEPTMTKAHITYTTPQRTATRDEIFARLKAAPLAYRKVVVFIEGETASVQGDDIAIAHQFHIPVEVEAERAKHLQRRFVANGHRAMIFDLNQPCDPRPSFIPRSKGVR